jgi:hypothetical protein
MIAYVKYPFSTAMGQEMIKGRSKIEQDNRSAKYPGPYEKSDITRTYRLDYKKWRCRDTRNQSYSMADAIK